MGFAAEAHQPGRLALPVEAIEEGLCLSGRTTNIGVAMDQEQRCLDPVNSVERRIVPIARLIAGGRV